VKLNVLIVYTVGAVAKRSCNTGRVFRVGPGFGQGSDLSLSQFFGYFYRRLLLKQSR